MFALLLQSVWDWLLTHDALLSSPFFPVLFSLGTYLLFCLPYVALDLLSPHVELIRRYKIQQSVPCAVEGDVELPGPLAL